MNRILLLASIAAIILDAQSRVDLLQRAAVFYNGFQTVEIRGEVIQRLTGTSWQISYEDRAWRAQPKLIPAGIRTPATDWIIERFALSRDFFRFAYE
jgi:membrane protein implicated in regulation of membrane protease activity